jgi:glycosyltransferase involved in cell wall biosynthesis
MKMLIAIPSKGRAGVLKSQALITCASVFVPENEVEAYKQGGAKNVVGVPSDIRGITRTRNWILDYSDDPWVVMIDDDLKTAGWCELLPFNGKHRKLTEGQWLGEWGKLFEVTEGMNYRIWGTSTDSSLRAIYPYKPFMFQSYVTASCMGIINSSGIRFDENFPVKEDYEICLRCVKEDGGIVAARYLYWENHHWSGDGGCKDYRTKAMERKAILNLQKLYPGQVDYATDRKGEFCIGLNF